jgi:hypothetical protein
MVNLSTTIDVSANSVAIFNIHGYLYKKINIIEHKQAEAVSERTAAYPRAEADNERSTRITFQDRHEHFQRHKVPDRQWGF